MEDPDQGQRRNKVSQLSAQSILTLCRDTDRPMISPFTDEKVVVNGKSYGLAPASYDVRIAHDLTLGVHPGVLVADWFTGVSTMDQTRLRLSKNPPHFALARTLERFCMPDNVVGYVIDKSSYARVFVNAMNTLFDPGFEGDGVLELVNLGDEPVVIKAGDPIVQFAFHWLDEKTDRPYRGKYFGQRGIQPAIYEEVSDGKA